MFRTGTVKIILLLLAVQFAAGCKNPFSHRDSENPLGNSGTWEVPTEPEIVVSNLLYSYNERNINNFRQCLTDSFRFSAYEDSVEAEQRGQGHLFQDWDIGVEESVTRRIFQSFPAGSDSTYMRLFIDPNPNQFDQQTDSTAVLVRAYSLSFIPTAADAEDTLTAIGEATFKMSRSSLAGWAIDLWKDRPVEGNELNWADFKALFR